MPTNQIGYSRPGYSVSVNGVRRETSKAATPIPPGGSTGSVLVKRTAADFDTMWMDISGLTHAMRNENGDFILNEDGSILIND